MARTIQAAYPRRADANNALGQVLLALGRFEEARGVYGKLAAAR